jgi:hypothetical protein
MNSLIVETEGEEETPLTVGIVLSLDRCLLMGDPEDSFPLIDLLIDRAFGSHHERLSL